MIDFRPVVPFCIGLLYGTCLWAQSVGPNDRAITDPHAISSASNPLVSVIPIEDLYFTTSINNASWSPDGKDIVFTTNRSGRLNLWKASVAGGWPVQLTQSDERQVNASWSPDGKWIAFQEDFGGNESWNVFVMPSGGGAAVNLTQTPDSREEDPRWSPDGKTIALDYKPKGGSAYDLALLDVATHKVSRLTHEVTPNHNWRSVSWSPNGETLYANRQDSGNTDADVYAVDVATGKATDLTTHRGNALNLASSLSPDGKSLLITSDEQDGYENVALINIASGKRTWLTHTQWEAVSGDFSPSGKSITYTINADGQTATYLVDLPSMHSEKLTLGGGRNVPEGYPHAFSPSGDLLLLSRESSVTPREFWIYDLASRKSVQFSRSAIASLASAHMPKSHIVHYKSFDGKTISALLWIPFNLKRDGSNPALVLPHGGPTGQLQDSWNPSIAALVSRGYICIAPNVRGSTGYGKEFQKANYQDLGGGDLKDEVFAAKFLTDTGYVNSKRIGITGGSYGGYMTLMAISKTPEVWAAGVEMYGIINWTTLLEHEDPSLQQYEKSLLGDPVIDRAVYDAASPITYIHNVKAPLLVLQGDNDPRVPKEEAVQVVDLLEQDGKTVEAHYYPNEGHGFAKRENQIDSIRRTLDWFDKYLKSAR